MKRIAAFLLACLLLIGCKAEPEQHTELTETKPDTQMIVEPVDAERNEQTQPDPEQTQPDPEQTQSDPEQILSTGVEAPTVKPLPESAEPTETEPEAERFSDRFSEKPEYGEFSYRSKSVSISISTHTVKDTYSKLTSYHVADIYVKDVTSIKTAPGRSFDTRYERHVEEIADDAGALLAINGDMYTHAKKSFIIRNGVLYRDTPIEDTDICILYRDGRMETKKWGSFTLQEVVDSDPWQVWGFGPALLDENGHAMDVQCAKIGGYNPRAAIGYYEPGHYCFVIVDGRDHSWSEGVKLPALSRLMEDLGCKVAYNLDGGSSAQLYWKGDIVSHACGEGRRVSDIIYLLPEE